jgi:hypothetical protein
MKVFRIEVSCETTLYATCLILMASMLQILQQRCVQLNEQYQQCEASYLFREEIQEVFKDDTLENFTFP